MQDSIPPRDSGIDLPVDLERNRGLAFLLSLGAMPACTTGVQDGTQFTSGQVTGNGSLGPGSNDGGNDGGTDTGGSDGSSDGAPTSTDPTTAATGPDPTAEGTTSIDPTDPGDGSSGFAGSTSGLIDGSSSEGPSTISVSDSSGPGDSGPTDDPCVAYGEHVGECLGADPYAVTEQCQYYATVYGSVSPACGAANDEFVACIAATDCAELTAGGACPAELAAIAPACGA